MAAADIPRFWPAGTLSTGLPTRRLDTECRDRPLRVPEDSGVGTPGPCRLSCEEDWSACTPAGYEGDVRGAADVPAELEPENRERYVAQRTELSLMLRAVVEDGITDGVFHTPYPVEAVRAVVSMCQAVAVWYRPEGPLGEAEVAQRYVELALDTLVAGRCG
ncbi:hypothetical protein ACIRQQ_13810 [Streptomyces fuscichromogenes]|uniref:hypothetical protein n=1 Tax=Streptomyces fuscichromogenes TaxID=1324013 RepID=UPI0038100A8D